MKRLTKKADYYDEHGFFNNKDNGEQLQNKLIDCANYFCDFFNFNESSVEVNIVGTNKTVSIGNIESDEIQITISFYNTGEIDRIIVSAGKNGSGQLIYVETREQSVLDQFLNKEFGFSDWVSEASDTIEKRF